VSTDENLTKKKKKKKTYDREERKVHARNTGPLLLGVDTGVGVVLADDLLERGNGLETRQAVGVINHHVDLVQEQAHEEVSFPNMEGVDIFLSQCIHTKSPFRLSRASQRAFRGSRTWGG